MGEGYPNSPHEAASDQLINRIDLSNYGAGR